MKGDMVAALRLATSRTLVTHILVLLKPALKQLVHSIMCVIKHIMQCMSCRRTWCGADGCRKAYTACSTSSRLLSHRGSVRTYESGKHNVKRAAFSIVCAVTSKLQHMAA